MPILTVGPMPGHPWCEVLHSVKHAVNNGRGARGLVHGPSSLNATSTRRGRISARSRELAKELRNGHLADRGRVRGRDQSPAWFPMGIAGAWETAGRIPEDFHTLEGKLL